LPLTDASVVDLIDRFNVINFARLTRRDRSPELHVLGSFAPLDQSQHRT